MKLPKQCLSNLLFAGTMVRMLIRPEDKTETLEHSVRCGQFEMRLTTLTQRQRVIACNMQFSVIPAGGSMGTVEPPAGGGQLRQRPEL